LQIAAINKIANDIPQNKAAEMNSLEKSAFRSTGTEAGFKACWR
jgi:hypothetical protein